MNGKRISTAISIMLFHCFAAIAVAGAQETTRDENASARRSPAVASIPQQPGIEDLVAYFNDNSSRIHSVSCTRLHVVLEDRSQSLGTLGKLLATRNRKFRLALSALGKTVFDLGSNEKQFWWSTDSVQYYCSHLPDAELIRRLPVPIKADFVMELLGLGPKLQANEYELKVEASTLELVEMIEKSDKPAIRKVIVMRRTPVSPPEPQVIAHRLIDENGKVIVSAEILEVQVDRQTGTVLPRRMDLYLRRDKIKLSFKLDGVAINAEFPETAFVRQPIAGGASVNKAAYTEKETAEKGVHCKVYSLDSFSKHPRLCQWIIATIPEVVQPGTWNGNPGVIRNFKHSLIAVYHTADVHTEVEAFLTNLKDVSSSK